MSPTILLCSVDISVSFVELRFKECNTDFFFFFFHYLCIFVVLTFCGVHGVVGKFYLFSRLLQVFLTHIHTPACCGIHFGNTTKSN